MVHIFPHWNHQGHEGEDIDLWVYSNCDEVELIVNKKSLGRKPMPQFGHCSWQVKYQPGLVVAKGYRKGVVVAQQQIKTSDKVANLVLEANKNVRSSQSDDIILVTVSATDIKGTPVPDANNNIKFSISGNGEIIGVGNGDPSSLENDKEYSKRFGLKISTSKELTLSDLKNWRKEIENSKPSDWRDALVYDRKERWDYYHDTLLVVKAEFNIDNFDNDASFTLYSKSILLNQTIYINDYEIAHDIKRDAPQEYKLDRSILHKGVNTVYFVGQKIPKSNVWDEPNTDPGIVGEAIPAKQYSRSLFSGKAIVVIKAKQGGVITLTAKSDGLKDAKITIK